MNSTRVFRRIQPGFSLVELMIVVAIIAIIAAIALPALNKNLQAGRETGAQATLRNLHGAQASFYTKKGRFGLLKELADEGYIDKSYASGRPVNQYVYADGIPEPGTKYCIQATRKEDGSADRDFNVTDDGVVFYLRAKTKAPLPPGEGRPISEQEEDTKAGAAEGQK